MTTVLVRNRREGTHIQKGHVEMASLAGVIQPKAKECPESSEARRGKGGFSP